MALLALAKPARACVPRRARTICAAEAPANGAKPSVCFEDLVDVIKAVDTSDVVELELKGRKFAMTVRKQEALKAAEPVYVRGPEPGAPAGTVGDYLSNPDALVAPVPPRPPSPPPARPPWPTRCSEAASPTACTDSAAVLQQCRWPARRRPRLRQPLLRPLRLPLPPLRPRQRRRVAWRSCRR